ncbi:MAG TPA: NAD(P)-dependent oxidoreductase [Burkholderiaceae bacterium]|nr:NAD(P)-dependent oxidoreductase [Burkholderiaceae bacterium]
MNVFIAGGSGAIGRQLVPMLVQAGHHVVAMTRTADGAAILQSMGATPVIGDVFDAPRLIELMQEAEPEVVIHQLTAFGDTAGDGLQATLRVRTEGTRNLVEAARQSSARRFIAQSISFICTPLASGLTDEGTPLHLGAPPAVRTLAQAVAELEEQTLRRSGLHGIVLRYGWFYGPGTNYGPADAIPRAIKKGRMALVGGGNGTYSFVHVHDAAAATLKALQHAPPGIYNIVDDAPAPLKQWLPVAARLLDAPAPGHMDEAVARAKLGDMLVYVFNEQSGASNLKAKQLLDWCPATPSWEDGFKRLYASA